MFKPIVMHLRTYAPDGDPEFSEPTTPIVIHDQASKALEIQLGTADVMRRMGPDIQIERRKHGWAIFPRAVEGGDQCGYLFMLDSGESFVVPENAESFVVPENAAADETVRWCNGPKDHDAICSLLDNDAANREHVLSRLADSMMRGAMADRGPTLADLLGDDA